MSDTEEPNQAIDQEREQLKRDVLEELRRETLKKAIVKELSPQTRREMIAQLLRHPAFLLLLGLLMTGVIGAGLTSYWQNKQWDYQQRRLAQIRDLEQRIKQKNDIKDQIKKDFETILSADTDVLQPAFSLLRSEGSEIKGPSAEAKNLLEEIVRWEAAEKQWESNANLQRQTITIDFKGRSIQDSFERLMKSQFEAGQAIYELKKGLDSSVGAGRENYSVRRGIDHILHGIEETREQLSAFLQLLVDQIEREASALVR